jgi:predicted acyl esterase
MQEGRDGYDTVEYIASRSWCNGSIAFVGNSWLGVSQWCVLILHCYSKGYARLFQNGKTGAYSHTTGSLLLRSLLTLKLLRPGKDSRTYTASLSAEVASLTLSSLIIGLMDTVVSSIENKASQMEYADRLGKGKNRLEDMCAMIRKHPLYNAYWDDKRAKIKEIDVPMYALASFSSGIHTEGSLRGFLFSSSKEKWCVYVPLLTRCTKAILATKD